MRAIPLMMRIVAAVHVRQISEKQLIAWRAKLLSSSGVVDSVIPKSSRSISLWCFLKFFILNSWGAKGGGATKEGGGAAWFG